MTFKFGKRPAQRDARSLRLASILDSAALPPIPSQYDFDAEHPGLPEPPMFGNDKHGDCVIAGRAHQTLRFELLEQGREIPITLEEVLGEWRRENGNTEDGLVVLDSLKKWRSSGWSAAGRRYKIAAFATLDWTDHEQVKAAIYLLNGVGLGVTLPRSVTAAAEDTARWAVSANPGQAERDPHGGHYVLLRGFDEEGPVCVTWGRVQTMTWDFVDKYADEAYAIIDGVDQWLASDSPIDVKKLLEYLQVIQNMT